jgi:NO-binding membrane sensor protein with MHYT domain
MYTNFFQSGAIPSDQLVGIYDLKLVILSFLVATMASYIALDLTGRLRDRTNTKKEALFWLLGGAIAMGAGIWSMHFIGMLSFKIPGLVLEYDLFWTLLSLFVAILASYFALLLLKKSIINVIHFIAGGVILGLAIASMHYTGMTAMLISLNISYLPGLFLLSIIVAILASQAAILCALKSNTVVLMFRNRIKNLSALTMGLGICGMHYTGMAASVFSPLCKTPDIGSFQGVDQTLLAVIIAGVTFGILGIAFFASSFKEAKNQQQFERARELGMAEISASVLHNVGNVLNSINISIETLLTNSSASPLKEIKKLADLFDSHKEDLPKFLTQDSRAAHIGAYVNELAQVWGKENELEQNELKEMSKNVGLIKNIISTQQNVIKDENFEQIVSINSLIDETLLLSGIHLKPEIKIRKEYGELNSILIDKIRLFQILGNLFSNAKEALLESSNQNKTLLIKTQLIDKDTIEIQISDNGIGISKINLNKIFIFGFTTKKSGHGFGLHTSALAVNELGGGISVTSKGYEKGATFTIRLPNRRASLLKEVRGV